MRRRALPATLLLAAAVAAFAAMLLARLSYPLFWQDEAETAMFARRILEYGYPKVHGERNVLYEFGANVAVGIHEATDAYIGTTWGHFYFAVPGVLWAERVADFWAKTLRVRLPFALAGAAGLALLAGGAAPAFPGARGRVLAALFFALAAVSISLLLHLREARYYALLVLVVGAALHLHWRHAVFGRVSFRAWWVGEALLLAAAFHVFFASWFQLAALLTGEGALRAWRAGATGRERARGVLRAAAPALASLLVVAPSAVFFETLQVAASFRRELGFGVETWAANLAQVAAHFARHEFLVAALVTRLGVVLAGRRLRRGGRELPGREARRIAAFLAGFSAGWIALGCLNPLVYERYFVPVSPLLALGFLLDAGVLLEAAPRLAAPGWGRAARAALGAALALLAALGSPGRSADVRGRLEEITHRYRGPLDFAIARIAEVHPRPEELVIATNYDNHVFMYYLDSHVIVGLNLSNLRRDLALEPDVVVIRRRWPPGQRELRQMLRRGVFREERLPVRDVHFNNVPALSRSAAVPDPHRFRTPATDDPAEQLVIHWRVGDAPGAAEPTGAGGAR
jgi:hypothetical protein